MSPEAWALKFPSYITPLETSQQAEMVIVTLSAVRHTELLEAASLQRKIACKTLCNFFHSSFVLHVPFAACVSSAADLDLVTDATGPQDHRTPVVAPWWREHLRHHASTCDLWIFGPLKIRASRRGDDGSQLTQQGPG